MSYPDTLDQAAGRILDRIDRGVEELGAVPGHYVEDEEQKGFRMAAQAGARAYAEHLRRLIENEPVTERTLARAELVATAAHCAGWLGNGGGRLDHDEEMAELTRQGFFAYHPAVPGRYVACYRLVAP